MFFADLYKYILAFVIFLISALFRILCVNFSLAMKLFLRIYGQQIEDNEEHVNFVQQERKEIRKMRHKENSVQRIKLDITRRSRMNHKIVIFNFELEISE